ncbi:TetR family transcriptional regulator [Amycolatopsis acidicola]|uniref:TetR family transcriptional regulator n=1 Tax=Amycolatopsis acidicola TaxID=2596893 RepID=A0A5N0VPW1_9PSEU|nr:TetR/AcrR family transcriptional regulator C-terminal domain-containing protein [Amycolatopsis acidicola]KAA9166651.1 TetR family transcriptional regulator [Amycolatopsis acidicola]
MGLSRQDIARAGLKLLNDVGLNGLTLRLIAEELGVKAPALYWHMKNKQELLDEMATQMVRDAASPEQPQTGDWAESLTRNAKQARAMMLRYRDGAKVFSGTYYTDETLPHEGGLRQLTDAGFPAARAQRVLMTVYSYVVGFTIEEQAVYPVPGERDERYADTGVLSGNVDEAFAAGLELVLAGARTWLS